ncbi:MAG: YdcH family protein [Pseudomonadota bacterium]|nr:YdcH family protein [Pseudomonadota bacterium]
MTAKPSFSQLKRRHAELEAQIADEEARPHPDDSHVAQLKKRKLYLKDEMERLAHAAA